MMLSFDLRSIDSLLFVKKGHFVKDCFYSHNHSLYIHYCFTWRRFVLQSSPSLKIPWLAVALHQHILQHLHYLLWILRTVLFLVLLWSPTLPGEMSRFIKVETNNFLSLSSVGDVSSLGLSTGFLSAVFLQMSWFVTTVAIPQVV